MSRGYPSNVARCRPPSRVARFLRLLGFHLRRHKEPIPWALPPDEPPDAGVREPRRPRSPLRGGAVALELPRDLD